MTDLVRHSAELAERLVRPLGRRWAHVQAVARVATSLTRVVSAQDGPILVAAAWLHDVGYAAELVDTGFHPLDGARYLRAEGYPSRIVNLVAHHSGARFEAAERDLELQLAEFEFENSPVMDALITADLTTGPSGETMSYQDRIAEILRRYPPEDPVHRAWVRGAGPLEGSIRRTRTRLRRHPMNGFDRPAR